ncbi:MAG: cation diffusion facilitator family transporter [Pseudomonadota bacterium]
MTTGHCTSGSGHAHHHHHVPENTGARRLAFALGIIGCFAILEVIGGLLSGSLALLADAGHMITDAAALALALSAQWLAQRQPCQRYPFGLKRAQVLAAFVNGLALFAIVGFLIIEACLRFAEPQAIDVRLMLTVACIGLAANLLAFRILHPQASANVNVRGAMLHVVADILGSVAAIVAGLVILWTGFVQIDAVLTLVVCVLIIRSAYPLVMETGRILLQAAPEGFSPEAVRDALMKEAEIMDVHSVRAWVLIPGDAQIALHVVIRSTDDAERALRSAKRILKERFDIDHSTIQLEVANTLTAEPRWTGCPDVHEVAE